MIGKLKGKIENIFDDHCLVDVSGVCYIVHCSIHCLNKISLGEDVSLFIHTMVKDEMPILYGFVEFAERELFIILTSVQGVGGKMAMNLIGEVDHMNLIRAIQQENAKVLQQVSGVGPKIALRIVNELKSNKKFFAKYASEMSVDANNNTYQLKQDAISALVNLGFKKVDVVTSVDQLVKDGINELESIIKSCITKLSR